MTLAFPSLEGPPKGDFQEFSCRISDRANVVRVDGSLGSVAVNRVFRLGEKMLNITVNNLGGVAVFRYAGRMTLPVADRLRLVVQNERHVRVAVLDLADVSAIDAAGLGGLVSLWNWSKTSGRRLKLMNVPPKIEKLLALTNLNSIFEFCSAR